MRIVLFLALLLPVFALAADPAIPPVLQRLQSRGLVVDGSFPGPDGLTGWMIRLSGRSMVVFTTSSGDYAINGVLVDGDGNNLSQQYELQYFISLLDKDPTLVDEGAPKAPLVYVYADANCSFCNRLWTELRPYIQTGKLHVRWAMVAFLKDTSAGRAAAIMAAKDRPAALYQDEARFDGAKEEGGIPPLYVVPDESRRVLSLHSSQMADLGAQGTPLILYHLPDGWHQAEGLPPDVPKFISGLGTGMPDAH